MPMSAQRRSTRPSRSDPGPSSPGTTEHDSRTFGASLRRLRKQAGLTQQTLANRAEIDRATVSLIENGHEEPRTDTVRRLAAVLRVNPADFWRADPAPDDETEPSPPTGERADSSGPRPYRTPWEAPGESRALGESVDLRYEPLDPPIAVHGGLQELLDDERTRLMLGLTAAEEEMLRSIRTRSDEPLSKEFFIDVLISFRRHRSDR